MLTMAFGESIMSRTQYQFWCNRFKEGREDVSDDARTDRPSVSTTDKNIEGVKKMVLDNQHQLCTAEIYRTLWKLKCYCRHIDTTKALFVVLN